MTVPEFIHYRGLAFFLHPAEEPQQTQTGIMKLMFQKKIPSGFPI